MKITAVVQKEMRQIVRDRRTLGVLLFVPIFLLVMFGYAISLDVTNAPIAIVDLDKSARSRDLIHRFANSEYFDITRYSDDRSEIKHMIQTEKVSAAVVIPAGFTRSILRDESTTVQLIVDGTNGTTGSALLGYVQAVVIDFSTELNASAHPEIERITPIDYRPRVWFNPELESNLYLIPGLVAFILVVTAVISTAMSVVKEKELGTMEQLAATPLRPLELIVGKTIPYMAISAVIAASIFVASYYLFDLRVEGSVGWLAVATLLFLFACLGFGIFISSIAETQQVAFLIAILTTMLPAFILSGFVFPIENMPLPIQVITYLIPARYYLTALRAIVLKGVGPDLFWEQLVFLMIFAFVTFSAGVIRLNSSRSTS